VGNHELALLEGVTELADFPEPEKLAERIKDDVLAGKVTAAFAHAGWFFTHAGVHNALLQRLRAEMRTASDRRFSLRRLADHVNQKLRGAVEAGDFTDPVFAVGPARGGEDERGGIFWADFDFELHSPARAPRMHQVFGHTPEGYAGARFRASTDGRRINIDIGIAEDYGGNLGYLEIVGREAVAHYIENGDEHVETMGVAPVAPKRKEPEPPAVPTQEEKVS